jgi:hypothetical protein
MRQVLSSCLLALLAVGCAPRVGKFKGDAFAHEYHTYKIEYAGDGADRIMGPKWEAVNWLPKEGKRRWAHRKGKEFVMTRTFDFDTDGNQDYFRIESIRDFEFKHRTHEAKVWLQIRPTADQEAAPDLVELAKQYLDAEFGSATLEGEPATCTASNAQAVRVEFSTTEGDADLRGRLILLDPGAPEKVGPYNKDVQMYYFAVYVARPGAFPEAQSDFRDFIDRLVVGKTPNTIAEHAEPTTCNAPLKRADAEEDDEDEAAAEAAAEDEAATEDEAADDEAEDAESEDEADEG